MLTVHSVSKRFGDHSVLRDVSFGLTAGQRVGLIGPNGCGKTTLLRLVAGLDEPDSGAIQRQPADLRLGYLAQGTTLDPAATVADFLADHDADAGAAVDALARAAESLAAASQDAGAIAAYEAALTQLEAASLGARQVPATLTGLGLGGLDPSTPLAHLSGGQRTRLGLAAVLLGQPGLLLLDEPTNHLDLEMLEWLEGWLAAFRGGVLVVSHDRTFLDRVVTSILELDPTTGSLRAFPGTYSDYEAAREGELARQWQAYDDQQRELAELRRAAGLLRRQATKRPGGKGDSGDKFAAGFFSDRSARWVGRAKQLETRVETLLGEDRVEKPRPEWQVNVALGPAGAGARSVWTAEDLAIGYDGRPLLAGLDLALRHGDRVVLVGPNGSGKSTLLKTIAGQLPPVAGRSRLGAGVQLGYLDQDQASLDPALDALTTLRAVVPWSETAARTFLHRFLFSGDEVFRPIGALSYGERARLILALVIAGGATCLLLDEPLNHLDIPARERFEAALGAFEGTVLAVAHDRHFIERFGRSVWRVVEGTIQD